MADRHLDFAELHCVHGQQLTWTQPCWLASNCHFFSEPRRHDEHARRNAGGVWWWEAKLSVVASLLLDSPTCKSLAATLPFLKLVLLSMGHSQAWHACLCSAMQSIWTACSMPSGIRPAHLFLTLPHIAKPPISRQAAPKQTVDQYTTAMPLVMQVTCSQELYYSDTCGMYPPRG